MAQGIGENKLIKYWFFCYPLLFGFGYSQSVLFASNQNTKLISGLSLAGYKDVASDWMAGTTDTFPLFSMLLKWQFEIVGLYLGVHGAFLLLVSLYGITGVWLAKQLIGEVDNPGRYLFSFSLIWMFIHWFRVRDNWLRVFPDGLGGQYMLDTYYQPCVYGVLLLSATAAYASKRNLLAAFLLILGALLHPAYLISSSLIAGTIVLLPANRKLEITWRQRVVFIFIFSVCMVGYSVWMLGQVGTGDPELQKEAHTLLAETRIPHHALLSEWDLKNSVAFMLAGLLAAWMARKHLIGQLIFVLLLIVSATLVWTTVAYDPTVAVAAPWRISAFLAPLSWVVILSSVAVWLHREIGKERFVSFKTFMEITVVGSSVAAVWGLASLYAQYEAKQSAEYFAVSRFIETVHEPGNQYMVPIEDLNIRMEAGVPVYVTWKTHPTRDTEFLHWYDRISKARSVYDGKIPAGELSDYLDSLAVTHLVWPTANIRFPYSELGQKLYADENYSLWKLGPR